MPCQFYRKATVQVYRGINFYLTSIVVAFVELFKQLFLNGGLEVINDLNNPNNDNGGLSVKKAAATAAEIAIIIIEKGIIIRIVAVAYHPY